MPPSCTTKYTIVSAIWALNSHYFEFCMQTRVRTKHIPKMAYVLRTHGFGRKIRNTGRSASILLWQSCLGAPRGRGYRLQVLDKIKSNLLNFWSWPYGFEIKKNRYFLTSMIHTFNFKYMSQYTSAFLDIPLNEIPSTSKPCHLSTGIPNFVENASNISVISTISIKG